ncbi:MAG: hypothetical protein ABI618_06660, partial [Nitrospirota bacterium]
LCPTETTPCHAHISDISTPHPIGRRGLERPVGLSEDYLKFFLRESELWLPGWVLTCRFPTFLPTQVKS